MKEIKDGKLIVSIQENEDKSKTITVVNGVKLSDVFHFLPDGMVIKDETGMGATYLELIAPRPSIIVEPLKYTASSKAHTHDAIYFGSSTVRDTKLLDRELLEQLQSLSPVKRKILVVADSLTKLREILGNNMKDYFLLIDEADSFQLDSTFRNSMGNCFDIYKEHPAEKRALLTATPIAFSEEHLYNQRTTFIKYDTPKQRKIELVHCDNINGTLIDTIVNVHKKYPGQKIMVAYNSLSGCCDVAKHLVKEKLFVQDAIKILCSSASTSRGKAGLFFHELSEDTLPVAINFVTSAYFTGFDLNEDYHQISVSDCKNPIFLLSDHRIKQISGRCRKRLLSEAVIFSIAPSTANIPSKDSLIKAATVEIRALECIKLNYEDIPLLKTHLSQIRKYIIEYTQDNGAQFVRDNIYGAAVVNYLSIDASLEGYRIKKDLYQYREQLFDTLVNQGHEVTLLSQNSPTTLYKEENDSSARKEFVTQTIDRILKISSSQLAEELSSNLELPLLERKIISAYIDFVPYIEMEGILKILRSLSVRDSKKYNNLVRAALFFTLPDNDVFKSRVFQLFSVGGSYSREELFAIWNRIFTETGMGMNRKTFTLTNIVLFTNIHFNTTKDRRSKGGPLNIKITSTNPEGFKLIKPRPIS